MSGKARIAGVVMLAVLCAARTSGEVTSGALTGSVTHEGAPLPAVTITLASPAMQGSRVAYSYVNGDYNFPAIPPGAYDVTFEMEGMTSQTKTVTVGLARTERVDVDLVVAPVEEAITVTAAAPTVLETTDVQSNYPAELVEKLPIGRTIQAITLFAPGVTLMKPILAWPDSLSISGGEVYDNLFLVNGAVTGENLHGEMESLFIEDAVQETSVLIGAISAEYGRFGGGVVSSITKSGGNEFSGSFRDSFTNPSWTSASSMGEERAASDLGETYEATVGGRIMRDRLWFFIGGRYAETSSQGYYASSIIERPSSVQTDERLETKLTGQINPRHSLVASYLEYEVDLTNDCIAGNCYEESTLIEEIARPRSLTAARYNGILSNSLFVEAGYSARKYRAEGWGGDHRTTNYGDPRDIALGTWGYDLVSGGFWGAPGLCGVCGDERRDNEYATLKATWYLATSRMGTHNIVGGAERFVEEQRSNYYVSGSDFAFYAFTPPEREGDGSLRPTIGAGDLIAWSPIPLVSEGSDLATESLFANDKWDLGAHWSFNIGMRYDRNDSIDSAGQQVSKDSSVSPRLGVIYDVRGDGRFRLNASYSKYVTKIWEVAGRVDGGGEPAFIYYEYRGPTVGGPGSGLDSFGVLEEAFRWFLSQGGTSASDLILFADLGPVNNRVEELESPNVIEWTLGFGMQLGVSGFARIDYVDRDWNDFYTRTTEVGAVVENPMFPGQYLDMFTYGNTNGVERRYKGLSLQGSYLPAERVTLGGNYTWSELRGNYERAGFYGSPFAYPEYTSYAQFSPTGVLSTDQTHKARLWIAYDQPLGRFGRLNVSLLESYESGRPYEAQDYIDPSPYVTNPGYATPPTLQQYYFTDRGEYRWDSASSTDLALNYELPIRRASLFVQAEILNLFDEQAQVAGGTGVSVLSPFDPFTETPKECPQGQGDCTRFHWQKSANFGEATSPSHYQLPRTYRFSAGVRF